MFTYEFDLPFLVAMIIGAALSVAVHPIVKSAFVARIETTAKSTLTGPSDNSVGEKMPLILDHFDLPFAATIGCIERIIYVFAVITPAYDLIIGWLIMKAFYEWLKGPDEEQKLPLRAVVFYHLYLFGNAISLMAGLAAGVIGAVIMVYLRKQGW